MQQCIKILLFPILNEAQHVSGETPPIIRSLKLHKQPLVLHTWKVVGRAVVGRWQVAYERVQCSAQCIKILLFLILNEAQHVSGDTPPIIRSLKLHKQLLVLHTTTFHVCKTRGCLCSFRLVMIGGVSPKTC
jgi:hypothetical protein